MTLRKKILFEWSVPRLILLFDGYSRLSHSGSVKQVHLVLFRPRIEHSPSQIVNGWLVASAWANWARSRTMHVSGERHIILELDLDSSQNDKEHKLDSSQICLRPYLATGCGLQMITQQSVYLHKTPSHSKPLAHWLLRYDHHGPSVAKYNLIPKIECWFQDISSLKVWHFVRGWVIICILKWWVHNRRVWYECTVTVKSLDWT